MTRHDKCDAPFLPMGYCILYIYTVPCVLLQLTTTSYGSLLEIQIQSTSRKVYFCLDWVWRSPGLVPKHYLWTSPEEPYKFAPPRRVTTKHSPNTMVNTRQQTHSHSLCFGACRLSTPEPAPKGWRQSLQHRDSAPSSRPWQYKTIGIKK